MRNFFQNRIVKQILPGVVVLVAFLTPLHFTVKETTSETNAYGQNGVVIISAEPTIAFAKERGFTLIDWDGMLNTIGIAILNIGAFFMGLAGKLLDASLSELVFGMGNRLELNGLGATINDLWVIVRDICNLAFIFGFVYVGFMTIIDSHNSDTKKMLAQIIIGALLINFSLFFTKAVIDASNFTAYKIYSTLVKKHDGQELTIATAVTNNLGLTTLYKAQNAKELSELDTKFWFFIFGFILLLIIAFTFFAAAFLLISRFAILILLMIGSPILFAALVFPNTKHYSEDLWKTLIGYSFFAPVYLLLVFFSLEVMGRTLPSGVAFSDALKTTSGKGFYDLLLSFGVSAFLMISALTIAQKMGVAGGETAIKIGNNLRSRGQRMLGTSTLGLGAALGRATAGRVMHNRAESDRLQDRASRAGIRGWVARQDLKLSRAVGDASFDVRKVGDLGKKLDIGEGAKGGYSTVLKEIKEKEAKFAKSFDEIDDDDPIVKGYKDEVKKAEDEIKELNKERSALGDSSDDKRRKGVIATEIEKLEKKKEENNKNAKLEKQRRVTGSAAFNTRYENANKEKKNLQEKLDKLKEQQKNETDRTILDDLYRQQVATEKRIKELHKEYKKMLKSKDAGYAGALEGAGPIDSWFAGRLIVQDREAGKAIRKANVKKAKKTKEDEKHDEILEATKSSKKD